MTEFLPSRDMTLPGRWQFFHPPVSRDRRNMAVFLLALDVATTYSKYFGIFRTILKPKASKWNMSVG